MGVCHARHERAAACLCLMLVTGLFGAAPKTQPIMPEQVLPEGTAPMPAAAASAAKGTTAQKVAAVAKALVKPIDASRGHRFDFSNEKLVREEWALPTDTAKWQLVDGGVMIKSDKLD